MNKTHSHSFSKIPMSELAGKADADNTEFDWFDVFYEGKHTSSEGHTAEYTADDLQELVDTFEPQKSPLVVGHPKTNSPAWGWISGVRRVGNKLQVMADNVSVAFARAVAAKRYPNRSIRIEKTPEGKSRIAHVGFLGGAAPALEGMPWQFSGAESDLTTIEFSAADPAASNTPEDKVELTQEELDAKLKAAADAAADKAKADAEANFNKERDTLKADADKANAELKTAQEKLATQAFNANVAKHQATIDKWVEGGKLVPAQTEGLADFMAELESEGQTLSFSKDGAEQSVPRLDFMSKLIEGNSIKSPLGDAQDVNDFSSNSGDREALDKEVQEYAKANNCSYHEALNIVAGG